MWCLPFFALFVFVCCCLGGVDVVEVFVCLSVVHACLHLYIQCCVFDVYLLFVVCLSYVRSFRLLCVRVGEFCSLFVLGLLYLCLLACPRYLLVCVRVSWLVCCCILYICRLCCAFVCFAV